MMAQKNNANDKKEDLKSCFIIMPISDQEGYSNGHFDRVYEHIIKPACKIAGFKPTRADEVKSTNYIALDIVKRIIESDLALCDLSSKNPNVLYEVGIRQAFDLPVTFIKDNKTPRIFDIQGFRDVNYDENLRIDTVSKTVSNLAETLINTYRKKDGVNSLISLLSIEPAKISPKEISEEGSIILNTLKSLEKRISDINRPNEDKVLHTSAGLDISLADKLSIKVGDTIYIEEFGTVTITENDPESKFMHVTWDNNPPIPIIRASTRMFWF